MIRAFDAKLDILSTLWCYPEADNYDGCALLALVAVVGLVFCDTYVVEALTDPKPGLIKPNTRSYFA